MGQCSQNEAMLKLKHTCLHQIKLLLGGFIARSLKAGLPNSKQPLNHKLHALVNFALMQHCAEPLENAAWGSARWWVGYWPCSTMLASRHTLANYFKLLQTPYYTTTPSPPPFLPPTPPTSFTVMNAGADRLTLHVPY